jgi:YVTN family beta-propeller protein
VISAVTVGARAGNNRSLTADLYPGLLIPKFSLLNLRGAAGRRPEIPDWAAISGGEQLNMPELPLVGDEFAGYRLRSVLGRGGMSVVYQAEHPRLGNVVAIKVLAPELASDDVFRTRFLEESRIAASMNHPNVIPIHDMGASDGLLYIVMRYVSGTDLRQMIKKRGRLQPEVAVFLLSQAARALDAAHAKGLVHRDVKPGNLLVERSNDDDDPDHLYLADFGITKRVMTHTGLTSTGQFLGTVDYVAPEQIRGPSVAGLAGMADQYSLGCVLYECLTGRVPFEKDMIPAIIWAHVEEDPVQPTALRPDLPPAVDEVFARVLAKQPGDRYRNCRDFMDAARTALGDRATPPSQRHTPGSYTPTEVGLSATAIDYPGALGAPPAPVPTGYAAASPAGYAAAPVAPAYPAEPPAAAPIGHPGELTHEKAASLVPETEAMFAVGQTRPPRDSTIASHRRQPATAPPGNGDSGGSGGEPPGGHGPRRGLFRSRRVGLTVLIVAVAAAVAVPVALVVSASHGTKTGGASATQNAGSSAGTRTAAAASSAPSLAVPTVAGNIQVGQSPSYIQVAPNGKFAYVANPGAGAINVIDTATDRVSGTIQIPQGPPQSVSFSPDSRTAYVSVYTTNGSVHLIAFVDTATRAVTATVQVDNRTPDPSATSPDGRFLYVPNHNTVLNGAGHNVIDVIDTTTKELVDDIAVPANPHWIVFGTNGRFYSTDHMSATVTVLNAQNNTIITEIPVGETPHAAALSPDGSRLAVTSFDGNVVFLINTATDKMVAQIPVGRNPLDIAYSRDGRYLFTANNLGNTVTVIDTADNRVIAEIPTGRAPTSISVLPNGRQAYVTDEGDGSIEMLNIPR